MKKPEVYVILHNIRSVYNVGSIFRTADALGVKEIILSGYTPTPVDRFNNPRKDFAKAALGAEKTISWKKVTNPTKTIETLKKDGVELVAVEQNKNSVDYKKFHPKTKVCFVMGNEVRGVSAGILQKCDKIIEIPMLGKKESLNVSVAFAVTLYRVLGI